MGFDPSKLKKRATDIVAKNQPDYIKNMEPNNILIEFVRMVRTEKFSEDWWRYRAFNGTSQMTERFFTLQEIKDIFNYVPPVFYKFHNAEELLGPRKGIHRIDAIYEPEMFNALKISEF